MSDYLTSEQEDELCALLQTLEENAASMSVMALELSRAMGIEYTLSDVVRQVECSVHPENTAQSDSSSEMANMDGDGHDAMVVDTADG
jgi:hypothetical protein